MANTRTTAFVNVAVPTILGAVSRSSTPSPAATATVVVTQSSLPLTTASVGLSKESKTVIGVVVAVVVLTLVIPASLLWFKYRKQHKAMMEGKIESKLEAETEVL